MAKKKTDPDSVIIPEEPAIVADESSSEPPATDTPVAGDTPVVADETPLVAEVAFRPVQSAPPLTVEPRSSELVFVKLVGANTAVLGGKAVLRGEVHPVTYGAYLAAKANHPGKFAVRYSEKSRFMVED